jgi:hypothetical protein
MIWIGSLAPNATLSIDGRKASAGNVNSALPGVAARIGVWPAEFGAGGFTVYTSARKYSHGATEPPGAQNGWNQTTFRFDERRAAEIVVLEQPSANNNWNRIVIRAGPKPVTALVIDWEVVP